MDSIREKLEQECLEATWSSLRPHVKMGRVLWVAHGLSLAEVGEALAQDDKAAVADWIASSALVKPSEEQWTPWDQEPHKLFWMVIVQPFVLIQEMTAEEQEELLQKQKMPKGVEFQA